MTKLKRYRGVAYAWEEDDEFHDMYLCSDVDPVIAALRAETEALEDKLHKINNWIEAYPLDLFPEPNMKEARAGLASVGITLDSVAASNMRHVLKGIARIIKEVRDDSI